MSLVKISSISFILSPGKKGLPDRKIDLKYLVDHMKKEN
jgi:hypothetical protein